MKLPDLSKPTLIEYSYQGGIVTFRKPTLTELSEVSTIIAQQIDSKEAKKEDAMTLTLAKMLYGYDENTEEEKKAFITNMEFDSMRDYINFLIAVGLMEKLEPETKKKEEEMTKQS